MALQKVTESNSKYRHLEKMPVLQLIQHINDEDRLVPLAVQAQLPQIAALIEAIAQKMKIGGRLFYIGAGTSGRLGVLDASECVPTFGIEPGRVIGIIAGGDIALRQPVEHAEDQEAAGWNDLLQHQINTNDVVVGIASSGTTPYVLGALKGCQNAGITTAAISCNPESVISQFANYPIEVIVGPEVVTGSTRMKSGTAQKMVLNMISTGVMVQLGRVVDSKMVHMQLSNDKLIERGAKMICEKFTHLSVEAAKQLLLTYGSVNQVFEKYQP